MLPLLGFSRDYSVSCADMLNQCSVRDLNDYLLVFC
jgi:hypothetical protein